MAAPRPRQTPDDRFNIIPDLKAAGYRHYLVVPIFFTNGSQHGLTFATRAPEGFGEQGLRVLRFVVPTIAAIMEIRVLHHHLDNVLRIYVGDEPHRAILSGTIRRGRSAGSARPSCLLTCGTTPGSPPPCRPRTPSNS